MLRTPIAALFLLALAAAAPGDERAQTPALEDQIQPILARHCLACHSGAKAKGDFHLDQLPQEFSSRATREKWLAVQDRVRSGEMPPKAKPRPAVEEIKALTSWIGSRVSAAELARRASEGRVVLRRLNRAEYENTVRELLGVPVDLRELLPADTAGHGFDNLSEALHVSSFLMDRYLEAADKALGMAIANARKPALIQKRYSCKDERYYKSTTEKVFKPLDDALVFFSSSPWNAIVMGQFYPPDRGLYRFRISASGYQSNGKPVVYRIDAGPMLMGTTNHLVGYFDAPSGEPAVVEFVDHFEARSHIRILPYGLANAQTVDKIGAENYKGPGLAVQWVEVEGPLYESWPPPSHRRLFGDLPQKPVQGGKLEVVSENPAADAARILRDFTRRAFRRAVAEEEVRPFIALVESKLAEKRSFEQAVRAGLAAVMLSPDFLFLREKPGGLDDFALASRLSYFLWSGMPDEELLAAAEQGKLGQAEVLRAQVERMLKHPKAAQFTENFVGQWLGLRDIDFTEPSHILYPEFDDMLKESMVRETRLFFDEVLKNDLSLTSFVASDFTMLNGRLAKHYGIAGVDGWEFRKVALPPGSHRGGVLTMASVLKVTANGTQTSPVLRGAWVLERILGTPPPPPPAGVPSIEPDIRGATTMRQQLAKHRQIPSCATCHVKIDPPGFALESFDVIGGWRENYRTTGRGEPVSLDGRRMPYLKGPKVDPADELPGERKFQNVDEFKQLLLEDKDQLARALARKLLTYATGAAPEIADQAEIETLLGKLRERGYGFRSLIHELVQSPIFRNK